MENIWLEIVLIVVKAAVVMFGLLLHMALFNIWVERKGSALIQDRLGANRAAIFGFDLAGIFNTVVADPLKALFKEDFVPKGTSQFLHSMGPFLAVFPVLVSFAVIPIGPPLHIAAFTFSLFGREIAVPEISTPLQVANLNVGILYIFAMGSLAVYGVVLAGWVSDNKFSLFGGLRASAQMISYEVTMGLSIIGVLAGYQTLDLGQIVAMQSGTVLGFLPKWGIFMNPFNWIAFALFFTSMMAETKRAPFDLPESESEIVAGYLTEYSGMKFLLFWLGEFAEITIASAVVVVLFFGGWQLPYIDITKIAWAPLAPLFGAMIFGAKTAFFCVLQIIIRWTLPRFRYDQLMNLCWKGMLPISLATIVGTVAFQLYIKHGSPF